MMRNDCEGGRGKVLSKINVAVNEIQNYRIRTKQKQWGNLGQLDILSFIKLEEYAG